MTSYERISVTPLTPAVGAELGGVDIAAGVDDETLRDIHAALMAHGVVFFQGSGYHADPATRLRCAVRTVADRQTLGISGGRRRAGNACFDQ